MRTERVNENRMARLIAILLLFTFYTAVAVAQDGQKSLAEGSMAINNRGMYVLGGWAVTNIAAGAYGWASFDGQSRYFSQMNLFWNVINLSIAGIALFSNLSTDLSLTGSEEMLTKHLKTEKIFLINSALDVGYMGAGFLMRHLSANTEKRGEMLKGYGNSVILQGGFLLVFDMLMYFIMRDFRTANVETITMTMNRDAILAGINFIF
jgi:hypothetical protein